MLNSIGKYILEEEINNGSYGICYRAKDEKNNRYAIKKIKKGNNENVSNIINEINILKIMKCKHSVEFIEYIEKDDYIYIVMELCDGDLNYLLKKMNKKIDIITIVKIIIQLNEVIKLMHEKKIEHRDLKPENILIKFKDEEDFDIKLTDYGFSKSYQSNSKYSKIVGTMYYSPPEVYKNEGNSKSDLWSIGLILYYLYFNNLLIKSSNNEILVFFKFKSLL
jgi:serine/threonine protein kinase